MLLIPRTTPDAVLSGRSSGPYPLRNSFPLLPRPKGLVESGFVVHRPSVTDSAGR